MDRKVHVNSHLPPKRIKEDCFVMNSREQLRQAIRTARARLTDDERFQATEAAADILLSSPLISGGQHIACYYAVGAEIDMKAVIERIGQLNKKCYFPILSPREKGFLHFGEYRPNDKLTMNQFGIPEPKCLEDYYISPRSLDLVIVPLVAFDKKGNRLGTGSGYYDRTFAFKHESPETKTPILCGYAFSFQEVPEISHEAWDVRLDYIVTENEFIDCSEG